MATITEHPQTGFTFEDVWAAIMKMQVETEKMRAETEKRQAETEKRQVEYEKRQAEYKKEYEKRQVEYEKRQAEYEKRQAESEKRSKALDAQIERTQAQVDKTSAEVDRMSRKVDRVCDNVGGLNRSMGELIETLIAARLWEKFNAYDYNLERAYQRVPLFDENNTKLTDIDILLSNGEYVMAVEVKRELDREKDIDHHLKRMELIKKYPPAECKGKKLLGAMAGGVVDADVQNYAHSVGFFVLELTGESVCLVEAPKDFVPRKW
ncbi:hypothetical protein FACS1894172_15770 [Spirochaetia bacterium]|nr:hypothetical protein FACS1894164_09540 [Spirochaetia bacterium]GHU34872.1 hypothetical protein FACS1894172_15770 [Spirochaetia bacterium]